MITIIHPVILNASKQSGGIETWIQDYLTYSTGRYRILGVTRGGQNDRNFEVRGGVEVKSITRIPVQRRLLPNLVRLAYGLIIHRRLITDNVMIHRIELAPVIRLIKPGAKIVLVVHTDLESQLKKGSDSIWRWIPQIFQFVEKLSLKYCSGILAYSKAQHKKYSDLGFETELGNAWYDDHVFNYFRVPGPQNIAWVGRLEAVKDPLLAIDALSIVAKTFSGEINFIGNGSLRSQVSRRVTDLALQSRFNMKPELSPNELAALLNRATVLLQTSHFEGSPRILVEALACGVRIVSTVGGDPELWSSDSNLGERIEQRDPETIAIAISRALNRGPIAEDYLSQVRLRQASSVVTSLERFFNEKYA